MEAMKPTRIITDPAELKRLIASQPPVTREQAIRSIQAAKKVPPSSTFRCK